MFTRVEKAVCDRLEVDRRNLRERNRTYNVSFARAMDWYILHEYFGVSIGKLAKEYNYTERNVKYMVAKIKFQRQRSFEVSRIYGEIMSLLRE